MSAQHTPTPWQLDADYERNGEIVTADLYTVMKVHPRQDNRANADFIIRACNAHDELVAALQEIALKATGINPDFHMSDVRRVASAALARVKP